MPRFEVGRGGGNIFVHPCEVCGRPDAPFGYDVRLTANKLGRWRCHDHRVVKTQTPQTPLPPPVPAQVQQPEQGDLF